MIPNNCLIKNKIKDFNPGKKRSKQTYEMTFMPIILL